MVQRPCHESISPASRASMISRAQVLTLRTCLRLLTMDSTNPAELTHPAPPPRSSPRTFARSKSHAMPAPHHCGTILYSCPSLVTGHRHAHPSRMHAWTQRSTYLVQLSARAHRCICVMKAPAESPPIRACDRSASRTERFTRLTLQTQELHLWQPKATCPPARAASQID
jgi:hypothetical protein